MAERVVAAKLSVQVAEWKRGMLEAAQATRTVGTEAEKLTQQKQAFEVLGRTMLTTGGLMAAGVGVAIAKFADFDQQMSYVAATGQDARDSLDQLREAAIEAGASTVFTASESANAIEEMAKAGVTASDILGGALKGSLDLAAAGGLGVARAAEVMSTTMQQFSLKGADASHVADLLAAGAGKAMGDVEDMSQALNQSGLVASQFGLSVEETTGTLAAFAQAGLLGSDAGTSFRTMLLRLANPTEEVNDLMNELGFSAYDSQGKFIGMANLAGELQKSLRGMTQQQRDTTLAMIFGQDAIRSANILLREGADGIRRWTREVDDQGYAAETAATRLDNLKGDIEALGGAVDSALITMGSAADGPGRAFIQMLTSIVDQFNALPTGAQQSVLVLGGITAAVTLAGGAFFTAVPKIVAYRVALDEMSVGTQRAARLAGTLTKGLGAVTAAAVAFSLIEPAKQWISDISGYSDAVTKAVGGTKTLEDSIQSLGVRGQMVNTDKLDKAFEGLAKIDQNWFSRFTSDFDKSIGPGEKLQTILGDLNGQLGELASSNLPAAQAQFKAWAESTDGSDEQLRALLNSLPAFRDALDASLRSQGTVINDANRLKLALGDVVAPTDSAKEATQELADAAQQADTDLQGMKDALEAVGKTSMDMGAAMDEAQSAINDLAKAASATDKTTDEFGNVISEVGVTMDGTNDASIRFRDSLRDVEKSHREAAQAILDNGGTFEDARAEWDKGREAIINQIEAMGLSRDEAEQWANDNLGSASEVQAALSGVKQAADAITSPPPIQLQLAGYSETYQYLGNVQERLRQISGNSSLRIAMGPGGQGGTTAYENGGIADYSFAGGGGIDTGIYEGGPPKIKFAEPETGWEAFISGKQSERARNVGIWMDTGDRLGAIDQLVKAVAGSVGGGASLTQNIYPQPGMSEQQIGDAAMTRAAPVLRRRHV